MRDDFRRLLQAGLGRTEGPTRPPRGAEWRCLLEAATATKTLPHVIRGLGPDPALDAPERRALEAARSAFQRRTLEVNARALGAAAPVVEALEAVGVRVVVMKGPFAQQRLYDDPFHRPSSDLDLLVMSDDITACTRTLEGMGFVHTHQSSFYWRVFVGQQHLVHLERPGWSIDLHHRIQPPGLEQPTDPTRLVTGAERIVVAGRAVPVPPAATAALLSAANLVKGLPRRRGVPPDDWRRTSLSHACDLLVALDRGGPDLAEALRAEARVAGLDGTRRFALRIVAALFGPPRGTSPEDFQISGALGTIPETTLATMLLDPASVEPALWPTPIETLAATCTGQPARRAREQTRYVASEAARKAARGLRLTRAAWAARAAT